VVREPENLDDLPGLFEPRSPQKEPKS
jgi:hypothetical protein